jgi:hypothetical protein
MQKRFRRQMQAMAGKRWKRCGWCAFAVDGSRLETPHTAANEQGLGCAGREKTAPQVFLTTVWHMGLGLPWSFQVGAGTESERHHLREMVGALPPDSLIVADAGFVGYELCRALQASGQHFLLRVGSNVTLLTELGYHVEQREGLVSLWPQEFRDQPPLVLRLIRLTRGSQTLYLLTDVLESAKLSEESAAVLYEMRWGVEVFYRSYKQTLDRRTLRSRTPTTCLAESQWTMLGLWLLGLLSVRCLLAEGDDPLEWSVAQSRDVVRRALRRAPRCRVPRHGLRDALAAAVKDRYVRSSSKTTRNYPRKKRQSPPGAPKLRAANEKEVQRATKLRTQNPRAA